jgi:hypothetical protein
MPYPLPRTQKLDKRNVLAASNTFSRIAGSGSKRAISVAPTIVEKITKKARSFSAVRRPGINGTMRSSPYHFALTYTALGETDLAFEWLDKAYEERTPRLAGELSGPVFDEIRSDPRFDTLVSRFKLPDHR